MVIIIIVEDFESMVAKMEIVGNNTLILIKEYTYRKLCNVHNNKQFR